MLRYVYSGNYKHSQASPMAMPGVVSRVENKKTVYHQDPLKPLTLSPEPDEGSKGHPVPDEARRAKSEGVLS